METIQYHAESNYVFIFVMVAVGLFRLIKMFSKNKENKTANNQYTPVPEFRTEHQDEFDEDYSQNFTAQFEELFNQVKPKESLQPIVEKPKPVSAPVQSTPVDSMSTQRGRHYKIEKKQASQAQELLNSPEQLRKAIITKEIFDKPLALR